MTSEPILAIDFGSERVGVAIGDTEHLIALPLAIFSRKEAEAQILALIAERYISTVVFGMPLNDDGTQNASCQKVRGFAKRIGKRAKVRVVFVDEYGSSFEALEQQQMGGQRKVHIDDKAAALILERYLESIKPDTR